jgi:hypothetical protein
MNQLTCAVLSAEEAKLVAIVLEETAKAELSAINQRVFDQNRPPAHTCAEVMQRINDTILSIRADVPKKIKAHLPNFKFHLIESDYFSLAEMVLNICDDNDLRPNERFLVFYKETYQLISSFDDFLAQNPNTAKDYIFEQKYGKKPK